MTHVKTDTPPTARRSMGKRIPNLVIQYDSEKGSEFRVQCEVPLVDEDEATSVKKDVLEGTAEALKRAKKKVLDRIDPGATPMFKQIVEQAFDDNIKQLTSRDRR